MDKNYLLFGQLYQIIEKPVQYCNTDDIRTFLETSGYDVNYQIPHDSLFGKRHPGYVGYTVLHFAIQKERQDLIELLLSLGADFIIKANNGQSQLRLARESIHRYTSRLCIKPNIEQYKDEPILNQLLSAHLKSNNAKNPSCDDGMTHFHITCMADNVPVARFFLQAGIPVNQNTKKTLDRFRSWTPLHFAVRCGSEELVELLLSHGADLNRVNDNGLTPLGLLVEYKIEIISCSRDNVKSELLRTDTLIDLIINKSDRENVIDDIGLSFFHVSCTKKDTNLVEKFLELGIDFNLKVNADSPMWPAYTPLHFAAHCNPEIFKLLVEKGADILAKDTKGETPLDLFIQRYKPAQLCDVLNVHPTFGYITFDNGIKLVDAISAMKEGMIFARFVRSVDVNIRLPENSPLWPGYTLTHLTLLLSSDKYRVLVANNIHYRTDLTIQDAKGMMTPLHLAFRLKKYDIIKQILEMTRNYSENCVDAEGLSHLQIACIDNNVPLVRKFLEHSLDAAHSLNKDLTCFHAHRAGYSLYHIAANNSSIGMMEMLSEVGAKMNMLDDDGLTAVHISFLTSEPKLITQILSHPETRKTNYTAVKAGCLSHLHVACSNRDFNENCHLNFVKELASVATDIDAKIDCSRMINLFSRILSQFDGWTALHFAVQSRLIETVKILINKGADIFAKNSAGLNPLHLALQEFDRSDGKEITDLLYSEFEKKGERHDDYGLTRLHVACIMKSKDEIESLLKAGEDVNKQISANSPINPGDTALHILIMSPKDPDLGYNYRLDIIDIIKLLIKYGADLTLKNAKDRTPLHEMWEINEDFNNIPLADVIMGAGPCFYKTNPSNRYGLSHFHMSCLIGNVDIVKNFIDSGVDINQPFCPFFFKYAGFTPLHSALHRKNKETVELLLQRGADVKAEDSRCLTSIQEAVLSYPTMLPVIFSRAQIDLQAEKIAFQKKTLGLLLYKEYGSSNLKILLDIGFSINFVDPPARKEKIAMVTWYLNHDFFKTLVEKATDVTKIDDNGKNVVHSLGSLKLNHACLKYDNHIINENVARCALNVNLWLEKGCDLNRQDKLGRTPLHDASIIGSEAVSVLLMLGADVNVRDNQGRTAFSYLKDYYNDTRRILLYHMLMMSCSGLYLEQSLDVIVKRKYDKSELEQNCNSDLARMADVRITEDMSLRDLLREQVDRKFLHFNVEKRNVIMEYLRPERLFTLELCRQWGHWINLFQLQYRKIIQRKKKEKLLLPANKAFEKLVSYKLIPDCIDNIFHYLSNYDLENLTKV